MVRSLFKNSQRLFERQQNSILSAASVITVAVFLSSVLGFIRTRLLVSYFFARHTVPLEGLGGMEPGAELAAYIASFRIPDFVFQLLVIGALSAAFIPIYAKYQHKGQKEINKLVNSMINIVLLFFLIISGVIFIFAYQLNDAFTGAEFSPAQIKLAAEFTRIMLVAQFFFAISSFMTGILQANQRFLIPALSPILYNLGIILGIVFLGPYMGLYGAALGVVLGAFLHLLLQLPLAFKLGYRYAPVISWKHPAVKELSTLTLPRVLAISVDHIETFIVTFLATTVSAQALIVVTLAQQLMKAPVRIFGIPIGQASLPFLSKESAKKNLDKFKATYINSFHQIMYMALPAAVLLLVLRIPLVRILFGAKDFPWEATLDTGRMVAIMSLAILAHGFIQLTNRAYYALHNTRLPLIAAIISITVSSFTSWLFVVGYGFGVSGIALGLTLGPLCQSIFLILTLSRKISGFNLAHLFAPLTKMVFAASLMGVFLWVPMRLFDEILDTTRTLNLVMLTIAASGIGGMVYLWLSSLLHIKQLAAIIKLLDKLGNWRKVLAKTEETIEAQPDQV